MNYRGFLLCYVVIIAVAKSMPSDYHKQLTQRWQLRDVFKRDEIDPCSLVGDDCSTNESHCTGYCDGQAVICYQGDYTCSVVGNNLGAPYKRRKDNPN
ncbi:hypothetical protein AC249_AIPGENE27044 [Exaiptasia diaphana]|nr:hypothetical protein AC249_AIPGENE27044 [Exaiptasia diaphana]